MIPTMRGVLKEHYQEMSLDDKRLKPSYVATASFSREE